MLDALPSIVVGGLVAVFGAALMISHHQSYARRKLEGAWEEYEHQYHVRQYRRRMQTSGLLVVIGVMVLVGDAFIDWRNSPMIFALYWVVVLLLALWVIMLGLGDWVSLRTHGKVLQSHEQRMQDLHRQLLSQQTPQGNGHAHTDNPAGTNKEQPPPGHPQLDDQKGTSTE
ncbi:MAG: hypothetical protein ACKVT0_00190 [Planctomycetaceae bacterium]